MKRQKSLLTLIVILELFSSGCVYNPEEEPFPDLTKSTDTLQSGKSGSGTIYNVNTSQQTCNPSISSSPQFTGCMLWLGFDKLTVKVPDEMSSAFTLNGIKTHDRLVVTDTSNIVRWFIFRSDIENRGEFQCPEWSTHPDYLACLIGTFTQPYSGYIIRLSDKKHFKICKRNMEEFSTPHLWVSSLVSSTASVDTAVYDSSGFADGATIETFFGTRQVKFVYTLPDKMGTLFYVDFSQSVTPVALQKPESQRTWNCGSPLISPDGNWITYHCYQNSTQGSQYNSYIQKLAPDSKPVLIAEEASDPHWWIDTYNDNSYYIIYTHTPGSYFIESDLTNQEIEKSGTYGATLKQKLTGTWKNVPSHIRTLDKDQSAAADTLVKLPFKGGLSPDGLFLATAYKYAYLFRLK